MSASSTQPVSAACRMLAAACILHAVLVFALWAAMFWAHVEFIPAKPWLALGWLWLIWPAVLTMQRERTLLRVGVPLAISLALLVPCVPTIFAFTVWSIGGFAP